MQSSLFTEMMRLEDGKPVPMDIQNDFLERGRKHYNQTVRRVLFQAPCGAGKTVVASEQTRRALANERTVMHIAPRRKLVDQMQAMLARFSIQSAAIMEGRETWKANVYCASRDTLLAMLKGGAPMPAPDLIIWDEAHVAANELQNFYLQNHPRTFWTGYTATPVQPDGSTLAPPWQALESMAPTSKMLELGRLVPVKVYNPDAVGKKRLKGDKVKPVGDPVDHWKKYVNGLPTIAYAATVAQSKELAERYNKAGIIAEHIDADTPEDEREAVFERSRLGRTQVITNCNIAIMGVDLPWLVCCQILRGCNSLVLWFQAIGRVMRSFKGKSFAIVLDHAAAAHDYGLPDADFIWQLNDAAANAKSNKPPKERKPVCCSGCGFWFSGGNLCPECGRVLPIKKRKSLMDGLRPGDSVLTEFTGLQKEAVQHDTLQRLFKKCYFIARARKQSMRTVAALFTKETGMPPWEANLTIHVPSHDEWNTPASEWKL